MVSVSLRVTQESHMEPAMIKLILTVLVVYLLMSSFVDSACDMTSVRTEANACLTSNGVDTGVEFLSPALANAAAVTNFCTTKISDIKTCIKTVLEDCSNDLAVKTIFGKTSALMAAYDGLCSEASVATTLVCAFGQTATISSHVDTFRTAVDALQNTASHSDTCLPVNNLHTALTGSVSGCTSAERGIYEKFFGTALDFPCLDVATDYYPCTLSRLNTDAIGCYTSSGVTVTNGFVPTPSAAHAGAMCTSKEAIKTCLGQLASICSSEVQFTILEQEAEAYKAAIDCMCDVTDAEGVLSCPNGADVATGMTTFTDEVHSQAVSGTLTVSSLCTAFATKKASITTAIQGTCTESDKRAQWSDYLATLEFPCTSQPTDCYDPSNSASRASLSCYFRLMIAALVMLALT